MIYIYVVKLYAVAINIGRIVKIIVATLKHDLIPSFTRHYATSMPLFIPFYIK